MIRLILILPVVAVLMSFALSNRAPVQLGLWPTDIVIEVPVSVAVLGGMAVAFVLGALMTWFGSLGHRRRANRAESQLRAAKAQVEDMRSRVASTALSTAPSPD